MQVMVISTHIEGFDPISCGLLFWRKVKRKEKVMKIIPKTKFTLFLAGFHANLSL